MYYLFFRVFFLLRNLRLRMINEWVISMIIVDIGYVNWNDLIWFKWVRNYYRWRCDMDVKVFFLRGLKFIFLYLRFMG